MTTKRIPIEQLIWAGLDWAVLMVIGGDIDEELSHNRKVYGTWDDLSIAEHFSPTTDWSQCGPLIERYKVEISYHEEYVADDGEGPVWEAMLSELWLTPADEYDPIGKTPLIAACRAIVAAHNPSGYVEVPEELVEGDA